ncbi:MAG: universal stress protein, partial [Deltaproteobacteria bacterium]|nr:universal stress protein [Deltaproteobacteria bacterium]
MKILLGYNGSEAAKAALSLARDHAKTHNAMVYVITSMEGGSKETADKVHKAERDLKFAKDFIEEEGIKCDTYQLARGLLPGEDIVSFADENDIDHIFMGIEKKSKAQKILLGSTAQFVILKASCPV